MRQHVSQTLLGADPVHAAPNMCRSQQGNAGIDSCGFLSSSKQPSNKMDVCERKREGLVAWDVVCLCALLQNARGGFAPKIIGQKSWSLPQGSMASGGFTLWIVSGHRNK